MRDNIDDAVAVLWDYMQLRQPVEPADVLVVLGSRDDRVASFAATLLKRGIALVCIVSGGSAHRNDLLMSSWVEGSEAEHFVTIMKAAGADTQNILIEASATNTGENATCTYRVLMDAKVDARSLLLVTKPYMERRALAAFEAQWPDKSTLIRVSSQAGSIIEYCNEDQKYDDVVNIMVGDFQRVIEYPKLGLRTSQPVPNNVLGAFETLVAAGFTKHLLS